MTRMGQPPVTAICRSVKRTVDRAVLAEWQARRWGYARPSGLARFWRRYWTDVADAERERATRLATAMELPPGVEIHEVRMVSALALATCNRCHWAGPYRDVRWRMLAIEDAHLHDCATAFTA